jgi:thiol-disulfide isomerase/thioredoxin
VNWFGLGVLVVVLAAATAFALWRRSTDGRLRPVDAPGATAAITPSSSADVDARFPASELDITLGERATLVQFSTAFCQPCRATRRVLGEVAELVEGVVAVEVDAEAHLDVVRQLNVMRTPTVFVLDGRGIIVRRASGQPRKADVIAAIGALDLPASEV